MSRPKTQSEKIAEQNKRAIEKLRRGREKATQLQNMVRDGKLTAAEALRMMEEK